MFSFFSPLSVDRFLPSAWCSSGTPFCCQYESLISGLFSADTVIWEAKAASYTRKVLMWIICSVLADVHLAMRHKLKPPNVLGMGCSRGGPGDLLYLVQILLPTVQHHEKLVIYVFQPQSRARAASSCLFPLPLSPQLFLQLPLLPARRRVCSLWLRAEVWELSWENCPLWSAVSWAWREGWNLGTTFSSHFVTLVSIWRNSSNFG